MRTVVKIFFFLYHGLTFERLRLLYAFLLKERKPPLKKNHVKPLEIRYVQLKNAAFNLLINVHFRLYER